MRPLITAGVLGVFLCGVAGATSGELRLFIIDDAGHETIVPLIRDEIVLGRLHGNTIRLTDRDVSPHHARIVRAGGQYFVEDIHSDNGTWVNGERVVDRAPLDAGTLLEIGG
jgi:pSer/pThr/pTyr-binding forkhead associated (FHA) protein